MIGRNDPCPCGSGKKHKKCCLGKSEISVETLVGDELNRIVQSMYEQPLSHSDNAEFNTYSRQWMKELGEHWDVESIEGSLTEYFFFIARNDLWNRHLVKVLNGPIRGAVRSVVEMWQAPFVLFGKVKDKKDGFIEIQEILGNNTFYLEIKEGMPADKNSIVFGIVLHDNRKFENGIYVITSLMFVNEGNGRFEKEVVNFAESSGIENSFDFYKKHMVDLYRIMLREDISSIEDLVENDLTQVQQESVEILGEILEDLVVEAEVRELLRNIMVTYFLKEQPNFRKPNIMAAALFRVAIDMGILADYFMTNIEVAELFEVSTSSITKHADTIGNFVVDMLEEMGMEERQGPAMATTVGTDPMITERVNWEMYQKTSREDFGSFEEFEAFINATMNDEFKPANKKEQAQVFAYDAYDAENDEDRYRLAEKAAMLDSKNVDVLLLQAEIATTNLETERLYASAIEYGKQQFEEVEENPWGLVTNRPYMRALAAYGVWLYENDEFEKAASIFSDLLSMNPADNQGNRYLAIASYTHAEEYEKALEILDWYEEESEFDAVYLFLDWYVEACMTDGESEDSTLLFEEAEAVNPFVGAIIEKGDFDRPPYPRRAEMVSGSAEEAIFIWSLLR